MRKIFHRGLAIPLLLSLSFGVLPRMAGASALAYAQDADITVGSAVFRIKAGSVNETMDVKDGKLIVAVPAGEAFEVRTVDSTVYIENDNSQPVCNVLTNLTNQVVVNGPAAVTFFPGASNCTTAGAGSDDTPLLSMTIPAADSHVTAGNTHQLFWSSTGKSVSSMRVRLSFDGGLTWPTTLAEGIPNNGFYAWNSSASLYSTQFGRIKIEGFDASRIVALAVSPIFTIDGVTPPPTPSIAVDAYDYDVADELATAATIGVDKNLSATPVVPLVCNPESRIKAKGNDTVYYCGSDGKRYVFPNRKTHDSWYGSFAGVAELELKDIQQIPLGGNVTYRPGSRMVKITTAPEVFAVAADGTLRYVSEKAAKRLYGADWNTKIDDLPDAFFTNYVIGTPVLE